MLAGKGRRLWLLPSKRRNTTSVLHDVEEGDHDAGDGLEKRRRIPPPVCVDHRAQSIVEDPPPHRESRGCVGSPPLPGRERRAAALTSSTPLAVARRRRSR